MALPLIIAGAAAAGIALWEVGRAGAAAAAPYLTTPGPLRHAPALPAPAAPTSDQLARGASWTPADMLERSQQQAAVYLDAFAAGARSSSASGASAPAADGANNLMLVALGLGVVAVITLVR